MSSSLLSRMHKTGCGVGASVGDKVGGDVGVGGAGAGWRVGIPVEEMVFVSDAVVALSPHGAASATRAPVTTPKNIKQETAYIHPRFLFLSSG